MSLNGIKIGFALTGSFYTIKPTIEKIKTLLNNGAEIVPIMSFNAYNITTRFGKSYEFVKEIEEITNHKVINTFVEVENTFLKDRLNILIIAPCTGNTLAKLANGIFDTPVLLSAKYNFRNGKNLIIGVSTNDGLSTNAINIGKLLNTKSVFFIPFRQNNPITKPNSLMFDYKYLESSIEKALNNEQVQPLLL